jgi:hypothetical protein
MRIPARKEREVYTCQADTSGWSVRELKAQIKADAFAPVAQVEAGPPLVPRKGRLYTYRVVEAPRTQDLRLDLGFRMRRKTISILSQSQSLPMRSRASQNASTTGPHTTRAGMR